MIRKGGVSQMDAGSRIAVAGYGQIRGTLAGPTVPSVRHLSLDHFIGDLCGRLPSFCGGYREQDGVNHALGETCDGQELHR